MDSLRSLASPNAHVIRDAKIVTVPSPTVVVGDIVEVKTGDTIPADLRLFETVNVSDPLHSRPLTMPHPLWDTRSRTSILTPQTRSSRPMRLS